MPLPTHHPAPTGHVPRWLWIPLVVLGSLVALVGIAAIVAQPLATHFTQKGLDQMKGYKGRFAKVRFNLLTLTYTVYDLTIVQSPVIDQHEPLVTAHMVRARIIQRELLRFNLIGAAHIGRLKLTWALTEHHKEEAVRVAKKIKERLPPLEELSRTLQSLFPFKLGRVELQRSELLFIDGQKKGRPLIWLHEVEASIENFADRRRLQASAPTTIALSGKLQHSGDLSIFVTADPLAKIVKFAGQVELVHLQLRDLFDFINGRTGLHIPKGTLTLRASFKSEDGRISGGVRPLIEHADVEPVQKDFKKRLEAGLADAALHIFSDDPHGRDAVGTTIPIKGDLRSPELQLVPTIVGVLRNAFVEGVGAGFEALPPPTAKERQGVLKQAAEGLSKDKGSPKAQPAKK